MLKYSPDITAKVKLQLAEPTGFVDVQMKNPDVSLEILNNDKAPSSVTKHFIILYINTGKRRT